MTRSLDQKLAAIRANPQSTREFILADAKDADMAFGVRAPGPRGYLARQGARPAQFSPEVWTRDEYGYRNLPEFLDIIREVTHQGLVDIMLMSAYVNEQLTIKEGLFKNSRITPACRANDTTDVWAVRHGCYTCEPSQPFRSASIDHIQCGEIECDRDKGILGANLGLYSVTFVNEIEQDREALLWYKAFREESERKGFRHFLEIFDPNVNSGVAPENLGEFINDNIIRTLAAVPESGRPDFLKIVYHGPKAMEELAQYDPNLVVGILGGSAGSTYDAFKLIHDAQKYGARVALYGRKINNAEHQPAFIEMLRLITDGKIMAEEAVRHITVVPEIEMPGHAAAAIASYPEFGNSDIPGYAPRVMTRWSVHPYTFAPKEETFRFLEDVLTEVCELFPSKFIHIGGDEAPKDQWKESAFAQSVIKREGLKDEHELQSWFIRRIERFLATQGRRLVGWDEIQEGGLPKTATMMVWRDAKWARHALALGNNVVMATSSDTYFCWYQAPAETELAKGKWFEAHGGFLPLEKVYAFNPTSVAETPAQEELILGTSVQIWTEFIKDFAKLQYMAFPRLSAFAEVAWTPQAMRHFEDFQRRLETHYQRYDQLGLRYYRPTPAREALPVKEEAETPRP